MASRSELPIERICENIDRLVNLDISGYGVIDALYQAARAHYGGPLSLLAARRLREEVHSGDWFCVTTGWLMPGIYPYGETDGPIGAAILGHALGLGLGAKMLVATEDRMVPVVTAACRGAGINVMTEPDLARAPRAPIAGNLHCLVVPFPLRRRSLRRRKRAPIRHLRPQGDGRNRKERTESRGQILHGRW